MPRPPRVYRVIASRNGIDLGYLLVSAVDEESALADAFWDIRDEFQLDPHDLKNKVRVELDEPPVVT